MRIRINILRPKTDITFDKL